MSQRIYLDNAATSWPKPPAVIDAISGFYRSVGSASGRGTAASEFSSDDIVRRCRQRLKDFIGGRANDHVVFAFNGTDAINMALWGLLCRGDHVITSCWAHNSVLRPLAELERKRGIEFTIVQPNEAGQVEPATIENAFTDRTRLVVLAHASNVTGGVQAVQSIGELCKTRDVVFMLDAAQTLGHLPIDVQTVQCDLLAAPGHKGLMGPLGTGLLYVSERVAPFMSAWRSGGTGTQSESVSQPETYPAKLESGNLNAGGIAGLFAALEFVESTGISEIGRKESQLLERFLDGVESIDGCSVVFPEAKRVGCCSFELDGFDPRELAMIFETSFSIQLRAGFHCAPLAHERIGSFARQGLIRVSPGWFNNEQEIDTLLGALKQING